MKTIMTFGVLFLSACLFGQSSDKTQVSGNVTSTDLTFEQYCSIEAVSVLDISLDKRNSVLFDGEVKLAGDVENLNYKDLGIELKENETQYFTIEGSEMILAVKSLYVLRLNYSNRK